MKINPAKIVVPVLAIAAAAATVGSISGTVAWFQYSTRVTAAYQGATAHCTENLEIRIRSTDDTIGAWHRDLTASQIGAYLSAATGDGGANRTAATNQLRPVTSGELAADAVAANLYKNPIYQYPEMAKWGTASDTEDYIVLPLELRVLDNDGDATADYLAKKIYISDLTIEARADHTGYTASDHEDVSTAIRVGVSAGLNGASKAAYGTFSKNGSDVVVAGALDLNNDGANDKAAGYEWDSPAELQYGYTSGTAASHVAKALSGSTLAADNDTKGIANDADPLTIVGKEIGATTTAKNLEVDLKIYLEGWTALDSKVLWANDVIGAEFNLGIRFSAEAHGGIAE